jgi:hypothetical protein
MDQDKISSLYRGPSIDVSYQVSVHLAKQFQRRIFLEKCPDQTIFFRNQPIRNKNFLWRPCLLTHREEMSNLNRGSSIDASCLVSVYLAKRFREEEFKKSANQKQESPVVAMFVNGSGRIEQSLQRTFHRCSLPSVGSFGQVVSEKIFRNQPIRNKNCLWWPCLLLDRDEMSNLYRGPSIDAFY